MNFPGTDNFRRDGVYLRRDLRLKLRWIAEAQNQQQSTAMDQRATAETILEGILERWFEENAPELQNFIDLSEQHTRAAIQEAGKIVIRKAPKDL
jgi:hypothetical protein